MTFITECELRELWKNGRGSLPSFAPGTRFSASALDFIKTEKINILYSQSQSGQEIPPGTISFYEAEWDKPGVFPVVLSGPVPVCNECGQPLYSKPDHMTQIDSGHFAPKTTPRLVFRGRVDSLNALVMLVGSTARRFELPELAQQLDSLAAYCREIMSAEYHWRQVARLTLMGKSEEELHEISHWPDRFLGIQHLVPGPHDHEVLHWLNLLRTQCREVEIVALQAFPTSDNETTQVGYRLACALNRLSSAVYVLELYFQSGRLAWKVKM